MAEQITEKNGITQNDFNQLASKILGVSKLKEDVFVVADALRITKKEYPDLHSVLTQMYDKNPLDVAFQGDFFKPEEDLKPGYSIDEVRKLSSQFGLDGKLSKRIELLKARAESGAAEYGELGLSDHRNETISQLESIRKLLSEV